MRDHPGKTALAEITGHIDRVNPIPAFRSVNALVLVSIASYVSTLEASLADVTAARDQHLLQALENGQSANTLRARLEKAEAELAGTCGDKESCAYVLAEWEAALATARNDALEEAAVLSENWRLDWKDEIATACFDRVCDRIRALKSQS